MNLTDSCTITRTGAGAVDQQTGVPAQSTTVVVTAARCSFTVLRAHDHEQSWGSGESPAIATDSVIASLMLPNWSAQLVEPLSAYSVGVSGYSGAWSVIAARPGRQFATYLLRSC